MYERTAEKRERKSTLEKNLKMFSTLLMTSALVLQAASASTVLDLIAGESRLSTLASALKASGLDATLEGAGPWTVFAPVDDAFSTSPWHDYRGSTS